MPALPSSFADPRDMMLLPILRKFLCRGTLPAPAASVRRYLSWENEQRCRGQLEASTARYKKEAMGAAVLVSLCSVAGNPAILYTLRSSTMSGSHKGEVSFPGGKCDDSDRDAIATALRETQEELGLQLAEDCVWGIMRPLPDRVEAVFTLSFNHLLQEKNQGYTNFCNNGIYSYTMPVFLHGPHRVWGLTAVITELTLELLMPGKYRKRTYVTPPPPAAVKALDGLAGGNWSAGRSFAELINSGTISDIHIHLNCIPVRMEDDRQQKQMCCVFIANLLTQTSHIEWCTGKGGGIVASRLPDTVLPVQCPWNTLD